MSDRTFFVCKKCGEQVFIDAKELEALARIAHNGKYHKEKD